MVELNERRSRGVAAAAEAVLRGREKGSVAWLVVLDYTDTCVSRLMLDAKIDADTNDIATDTCVSRLLLTDVNIDAIKTNDTAIGSSVSRSSSRLMLDTNTNDNAALGSLRSSPSPQPAVSAPLAPVAQKKICQEEDMSEDDKEDALLLMMDLAEDLA